MANRATILQQLKVLAVLVIFEWPTRLTVLARNLPTCQKCLLPPSPSAKSAKLYHTAGQHPNSDAGVNEQLVISKVTVIFYRCLRDFARAIAIAEKCVTRLRSVV